MTKRGANEGSIFKRTLKNKDGKTYYKWEARIQIGKKENGTPLIKSFSSTNSRQNVIDKLNEFKKQDIGFILKNEKILFRDYINVWADQIKKPLLKPTSIDRLDFFIQMITSKIGQYNADEINFDVLQKYVNTAKNEGYSRETIKKSVSIVKSSLDHAIKRKHIQYNHANDVIIPSTHAFIKTNHIEIFTEDELKRFKIACTDKHADGSPRILAGYAFIFMLNTGLRIGEMIALDWTSVNLKDRSILICKNAVRIKNNDKNINTKWVLQIQDSLKTKSSYRKLSLNDNALGALMAIKNHRFFGDGSLVFPSEKNTITSKENLQRSLDYILKKANITHKGTHVLRHTYASHLLKNKIDIKTISAILGHSDVKTTMQTYIHTIEEYKDAVMLDVNI